MSYPLTQKIMKMKEEELMWLLLLLMLHVASFHIHKCKFIITFLLYVLTYDHFVCPFLFDTLLLFLLFVGLFDLFGVFFFHL